MNLEFLDNQTINSATIDYKLQFETFTINKSHITFSLLFDKDYDKLFRYIADNDIKLITNYEYLNLVPNYITKLSIIIDNDQIKSHCNLQYLTKVKTLHIHFKIIPRDLTNIFCIIEYLMKFKLKRLCIKDTYSLILSIITPNVYKLIRNIIDTNNNMLSFKTSFNMFTEDEITLFNDELISKLLINKEIYNNNLISELFNSTPLSKDICVHIIYNYL